jgi:Dimerisation domain
VIRRLRPTAGREKHIIVQEPNPVRDCDVYRQMTELLFGVWVSQAVQAVEDLSLAGHLAGGGLTAAEVAEREGSAPDSTFRVMRAAVAIGLLNADSYGRFRGTPLLTTLSRDAPRSLRPLAMAATDHAHCGPEPSSRQPSVEGMRRRTSRLARTPSPTSSTTQEVPPRSSAPWEVSRRCPTAGKRRCPAVALPSSKSLSEMSTPLGDKPL